MSVDLRKCKFGDKLLSKLGAVLTYGGKGCSAQYPHMVIYADGTRGTRTDEGYAFRSCHSPDDHDIVGILTLEKAKVANNSKVAKFSIKKDFTIIGFFYAGAFIGGMNVGLNYSSKRNAIRGAHRFCKRIGYECEIVGAK